MPQVGSTPRCNLDASNARRIVWESDLTRKMLAEVGGDRAKLRAKLNEMRVSNWKKAFKDLNYNQDGLEAVEAEEAIETKGQFKINRTKRIGMGQFSKLYHAQEMASKRQVCVKVIATDEMAESLKMKNRARQARLIGRLEHPQLIRLLKNYEVRNTKRWYMFLQVAPLGSVESLMKANNGKLDDELAQIFAADVARALSYLHFLGIAHRRVNPKHVMLYNLDSRAKLAFPDYCHEICEPDTGDMRSCRTLGTPNAFCAPETIFGGKFDPFPADVWAFGCTIYYMLVARPPFDRWDNREQMKSQLRTRRWTECGIKDRNPKLSEPAKAFLMDIIRGTIDRRPTMTEILGKSWLQGQ